MGFPINADGSLRPFNAAELAAMELKTAGVKDGSNPRMTLGERQNSIRCEWFCKWSQRDNAICALLGGAKYICGSATLSRVMPMSVPGYPAFVAVEIESVTGTGGCGKGTDSIPTYPKARIVVRHELVYYLLEDDAFTITEYDRYVEVMPSTVETNYLTVPGSMITYRVAAPFAAQLPGGNTIPYSIGHPETTSKIGRKWHRVPRAAWENSPLQKRVKGGPPGVDAAGNPTGGRGYIGTVNKTPILGRPSGTLLLLGVDEEIVGDATVDNTNDPGMGDYAYNLTYWWLEKTTGGGLWVASGVSSGGPNPFGGAPPAREDFGHNYLYFGGVVANPPVPSTTGLAGYYLATKNPEWVANGSIPDGTCLFDERDHNRLFDVSA